MFVSCKKGMDQLVPEPEKETFRIKLAAAGENDLQESAASSATAPVLDSLINQLTLVLYKADSGQEYTRVVQFKN